MTDSQLKALLTAQDDEAQLRQPEQWRALRREIGLDHRTNRERAAAEGDEDEVTGARRGLFAWWPFSGATTGLAAAVVAAVAVGVWNQAPGQSQSASVKSTGPGVAANAYYSRPANADVVWVSGGEKGAPTKKATPPQKK